jgi:signal transduction histidine kinase
VSEGDPRQVSDLQRARDQAIADLDAFTHSVSHDLRFPLRVIEGYTKALEEDCASQLDEQGRSYMSSIRGGVQRMEKMIAALVDLARMSQAPDRAAVDLSALAHAAIAELRRKGGDRQVTVEIADGLVGEGDRSMLKVVFANLLGNAWKFTGRVEAPRIEVGSVDGAVFVRDNGVGFDPTRADRLFSPFRRFHGSDDFPGTGVGLAMVQRAIVRHGGRIWAEAAIGRGATFYFTRA